MKWVLYIISCVAMLSLQACLYPSDSKATNHMAYQAQVTEVQQAVEAYKKDTGVLPIKNSTPQTPIFEQNRIDFNRLVPQYLPKAPMNAYEEGGYFQYLIVNAETNPTVKVYDLTFTSIIQDLQNKIAVFRLNKGFSPVGKILGNDQYSIDYKAIGYSKPPQVISPYSGQPLDFYMDKESNVYINYLPDLFNLVKKTNDSIKPGIDLRPLLYKEAPYVPIASLPYVIDSKGDIKLAPNLAK